MSSQNSFVADESSDDEESNYYSNATAMFKKSQAKMINIAAQKLEKFKSSLDGDDSISSICIDLDEVSEYPGVQEEGLSIYQPKSTRKKIETMKEQDKTDYIEISDSPEPLTSEEVAENTYEPRSNRKKRKTMIDQTITDFIEISDSPEPEPLTLEEEVNDNLSSSRRVTRSSASRRFTNATKVVKKVRADSNKKKGRKNDVDKALDNLDRLAHEIKSTNRKDISNISADRSTILCLDSEEEEEEETVNVKIDWCSKDSHSFPIGKNHDLSSIFEFFAKQENVNIDNIIITKAERLVSPMDTPKSLGLVVIDVLWGFVSKDDEKMPTKPKKVDKDCIEIKVQQQNVKKPLMIQLHKSNNMIILAKKVATELNVDYESLKFSFDGDPVDLNDTVESLCLENLDIIDLMSS